MSAYKMTGYIEHWPYSVAIQTVNAIKSTPGDLIPVGYQRITYGDYEIDGDLILEGDLVLL